MTLQFLDALTTSRGPRTYPIRQPVMAYVFESDPAMTTLPLEFRMRCDGKRLPAVVKKLRIALIRENPDIVLPAKLRNTNEFLVINHGAAGIVRRIHDQHSCLRSDRSLEHLRGEAESLVFPRVNENGPSADIVRDIGKRHPVRCRDDDVVAFIHQSRTQIEDRVLAADVHDAFGNVVAAIRSSRACCSTMAFRSSFDSADRACTS